MKKIVITVVGMVLVSCLGLPVLLSGSLGGGAACPGADARGLGAYDAEQLDIAGTIVDVGVAQGVPRWGWIVAVATALQESGLRNLPHLGEANDHDSVGVFQQRPSQGWGTTRQLTDPAYQARGFYERLLRVPGWQQMSLTEAAQAVQRSAYPDAYGRWAGDSHRLVDAVTSGPGSCEPAASASLPHGFTLPPATPAPVVAAISWALRQLGTPYAFGGSCTDPHAGNPNTQCDCSSLVQQAYRAAGISIPRVTTDQVRTGRGVPSPQLLEPGDLVFIPGSMGSPRNPRHVGMYIGAGMIVQAPAAGDVIKISQLEGWRRDIVAIRRFI
ncbi:cell wall-associated NlpC family hydrolase [Micromonospora kangleipakensis]|uniref:Cell wall-associated NlpC family hydrolase n=1 Tax=Micromonospora kangleipakensis TaxID=1077942 RepID=A0A4Q8BDR4_9ACTN|nr:C40 family peptidase [Micromonospora kangleipakensis]RZU76052.1 cell wall-associated NlpC family hydrolase [Micromonospora kangleipakensis]